LHLKFTRANISELTLCLTKTINAGHSLLNEVLKLICLDVQMNVYAELAKIKTIKPVDFAFNIIKWRLESAF
jgi:hypothetical protein